MPKKKVHLSPEERKELRKQKKLQRKLQKAEKKRQIKRDHLGREIKYGALTYKKYEKDWKTMLVKVALPRMREELEFAWHNFERVIDCKDFTISLLMDELKDSEEQYMHNFRAHAENIDKLMGIFHDRLDELRRDYDEEVQQSQERCNNELQNIKDLNNDNMEYLKTMLYRLELEKKEHIRQKRGEYLARLDQAEVNNQLLLQKLRAALEKKYQTMFDEMKSFLQKYRKQNAERKKEHNALKEQDDAIQELIGQQFRQIKKFYDIIRQLKQQYTDMKQTEGYTLLDLQVEKQYFSNSFLTLKQKLEKNKQDDFNKLAILSDSFAKAYDYLENLNKKGETILSLCVVCRKLETQKEKVLPFPATTMGNQKPPDECEEIEGVIPEMELFWQRLGQAFGVHYALSREKKFLGQENQLLIDTHNNYCEKLEFPGVKAYKNLVAIPKFDANLEMNKYTKMYKK